MQARQLCDSPLGRICEDRTALREDRAAKSSSLSTALKKYHTWECTEPRNIFYALMGLVLEQHEVKIDYSMSIPQLVFQFIRIMEESGDVGVHDRASMAVFLLRQTKADIGAGISSYDRNQRSRDGLTVPACLRGYVSVKAHAERLRGEGRLGSLEVLLEHARHQSPQKPVVS